MIPVIPSALHEGASLVMIAEHQEEYLTLPASVSSDGLVMSEWQLTEEERNHLLMGGRVRLWIHTFNHPLQPMSVEVTEPVKILAES